MKDKVATFAIAILIMLLFQAAYFTNFRFTCFGSNETIIVDGGSIQAAINNANEGDIIFVKAGNYSESIVVNKTVSIIGENAEKTIIDGNGIAEYIFHVIASNVIIENFTLRSTNPDPNSYSYAVGTYYVVNVTFKKLIITDVVIGFDIRSSNFTRIFGNQVEACKSWALRMREASCNNTVVDNLFENNPTAIYFADSKSKFSMIYHNSFINNSNNVVGYAVNYFDNGYPSGGNYWSNQTAPDLKCGSNQDEIGSDGILDESYLGWDRYPFAHPIAILEIPVSGEIFEVKVSTNSSINFCVFNPEERSLNLFLGGIAGTTGSCRISIPKELLSCDSLLQWNVTLSDSEHLTYLASEDEERTYLYFTYNQLNDVEIEIKGINAVPEFPHVFMLLVLSGVMFASCIFCFFKKKGS